MRSIASYPDEARRRENYLKSLKGGNEFKKLINKYSEIV